MCKFGSLWRFFPVHWTFILVSGILMETPKQKKASQPSNSPTIRVHSRSCSLFIINAFHFKKCPSDRQQYNNKYFKFTSATHPGWIDGRFIYVVSLFYLYLLVGWMLLRPRGAGYWRGVLGLFIQPLCPASRQKKNRWRSASFSLRKQNDEAKHFSACVPLSDNNMHLFVFRPDAPFYIHTHTRAPFHSLYNVTSS